MPRCGIYAIINYVNHSCYVGSAVDFQARKARHLNELRQGKHHSRYLQNAYNKYGEAVFRFIFLEDVAKDKKLLHQREGHWIQFLCPEYNVGKLSATSLGAKRTEEIRKHMSESASKRPKQSPEAIERGAAKRRGRKQPEGEKRKRAKSMLGHAVSEEAKRKTGEGYKIFWASLSEEEQQAITAKRMSGRKPISETTRQKQSLAKKDKKQSPEHVAKRAATNTGSKRSEETRANMRAAQQALAAKRKAEQPEKPAPTKTISASHKERISQANKEHWARRKAAKQQQTNTQPPLFNL